MLANKHALSQILGGKQTMQHFNVDRAFDNDGVPDSNTVFQLNFGVDDAKCLVSGVAVANSLLANVNVAMNIALDSKLITGDTYLSDPQDKIFIYQLPGSFVRRTSINNADYEYDKMVMNKTVSGTPGVFVIGSGTLAAAESIPWSGTTSSIRDNLVVYVRDKGAFLNTKRIIAQSNLSKRNSHIKSDYDRYWRRCASGN